MNRKYYFSQRFYVKHGYLILSIIAVATGGIIYVLFRPSEPDFFRWIYAFGFEKTLGTLRQNYRIIGQSLPEWMVYSLPNGLWAFAYSLFIINIWWKNTSILKYFWIGTIPVLILGFELLQYPGIIQGTFCLQDIGSGIIGIILGIWGGIKFNKLNSYEKEME